MILYQPVRIFSEYKVLRVYLSGEAEKGEIQYINIHHRASRTDITSYQPARSARKESLP
jgi:hypothetical protein